MIEVKVNTIWKEKMADQYVIVTSIVQELDDITNNYLHLVYFRYLDNEQLNLDDLNWEHYHTFFTYYVPVGDL